VNKEVTENSQMTQIGSDLKDSKKSRGRRVLLVASVFLMLLTTLVILVVSRYYTPSEDTATSLTNEIGCPPGTVEVKVVEEEEDSEIIKWECKTVDELDEAIVDTFEDMYCGCEDVYEPVCTTEYFTYPNACVAECENVVVAHDGACKVFSSETVLPESCPSCAIECDVEEFFPEKEDGCPYCVCRSIADSWYEIDGGEDSSE
jgi:hypothetical protein